MPLRITLELIPRGDESRKRGMGTLYIENTRDHPHHPKMANYRYHMTGPIHGGGVDVWHEGVVKDVERARGYWAHVKEILNRCDCESQPMDEA